jgi:hypothetical protein
VTGPTLITIDGEKRTIPEARVILGIPEGECFGCYLGDASPDCHDLCYLADV